MNKFIVAISLGAGGLIVLITVLALAILKPGVKSEEPSTSVVIESTADTSVEIIESTQEQTTANETEYTTSPTESEVEVMPSTESFLEFGDRMASEDPDEFVVSTPVNGKEYYKLDTQVLVDSSWLPDMQLYKILLEDDEYVSDIKESDIVIHHDTYQFDGDTVSVDYTVTLPSGVVGRYTLYVDVAHRIIYSNY